jgi:hypothetical protein
MIQAVKARFAGVVFAAAVTVIAACSDSGSTQPLDPSRSQSGGLGGDTAHSGKPGSPGAVGDTGKTNPPTDSSAIPKPVASFTLDVAVLGGSISATDTLLSGPLPGVRIDVYEQTVTFIPGNGTDTARLGEALITSGTTDATGHVVFPKLKGESYIIKGTAPDGSGYQPFKGFSPVPYTDKISMTFVMRK